MHAGAIPAVSSKRLKCGVFRSLGEGGTLASSWLGGTLVGSLTESRVQHVQSHTVALLRAGDGDQALVAVVLGLVDLDHTAADLPDFVDLLATFADDGADHVVGNVDLLCKRCTRHASTTVHGLRLRSAVDMGASVGASVRLHVGLRAISASSLGTVVHWDRRVGLSRMRGTAVWRRIGLRHLLGARVMARVVSTVILTPSVVAASRLGHVGDDLHASRNSTCGSTAPCRICRGGRTAESLVQLFEECASNVVRRNVNGVCHTHYHQRALGR